MITWKKRLLLTCTILGLLATNVLRLTSTAFSAALSGFMSIAPGVATVADAFKSKIAKQDQAIKRRKAIAKKIR
mgnify:CR=1 FL=1